VIKIKVEHQPNPNRLEELGVKEWSIWEKEVSDFPWTYDSQEICYFLEGDVVVTTEQGEAVAMGKGDLVTFPMGLRCHWSIKQAVKKHYIFN
jgi:uncharacterized protein